MKARITYRMEVIVNGDSIDEIKAKWESVNLRPVDDGKDGCNFDYIEVVSAEDENYNPINL